MSGKHGPNSWHDYLEVHRSRLADFADHFIIEDRLTSTRTRSQVVWKGELLCADGIEIHVTKTQEVTYRGGQPWVETVDYSYHVFRRHGQVPTHLVRYDNSTHHRHPDPHHRHRYDANGREILPPEHVGEAAGQRSVRSSRRRMRCGDRVAEGRGKGGFKSGRSAKTDYDGYCP